MEGQGKRRGHSREREPGTCYDRMRREGESGVFKSPRGKRKICCRRGERDKPPTQKEGGGIWKWRNKVDVKKSGKRC